MHNNFNISSKEFNQLAFKRLELRTILIKNKIETNESSSNVLRNSFITQDNKSSQLSLLKKEIGPQLSKKDDNALPKYGIDKYKKDSYFFKYSRLNEYKKLGIELASPEKIRKWGERLLPTGKIVGLVLNANTLHHKTLKPLKGGLFCERIFGPTKDFRCACGKTITKRQRKQNNSYSPGLINLLTPTSKPVKRFFCKICEVEYTWALTRRYQLGYISLAFPVTHLWYSKGFSNPISLLFDIHKYDLDTIIYCSQTTSIEKSYEITDMNISSNTSIIFDSLRLKNINQFILSKPYKIRQKFIQKYQLIKNNVKISNISNNNINLVKNTNYIIKNNKIDKLINLHIEDISDINTVRLQTERVIGDIPMESSNTNKIGKNQEKRNFVKYNNKSYLIKRDKKTIIKSLSNITNEFPLTFVVSNINNEFLLFKSLVTPLLAIYSTKEFAPFVLWLIGTLDHKITLKQDQLNTFITSNLFKEFFSEEEKLYSKEISYNDVTVSLKNDISKNLTLIKEKDNITKIANILINLKNIFINSLNLLDKSPSIIERKYHKYLIQLRKDIYLLPKQLFKKLNKQIYKESYKISSELVKEVIESLTLRNSRNTLIDFKYNIENETIIRLKYYLNKLKQVINDNKNTNVSLKQKHLNLNELAAHFLFYKFKKKRLSYFENNKLYKYNIINRNSNVSLNNSQIINQLYRNIKKSSPLIYFYYNLYSIADDQLWENINDWNLIKSYITLNPDLMDIPIPAYIHRIPISGISNIDYKSKTENLSNIRILKYKNLSKKYNFNELKNEFVIYQKFNNDNILQYKQFLKNTNYKQAVPIKSTGAGILNKLLRSLNSNELKSMDQQLTCLLKESRKGILLYKTKIGNNVNYYNLETKKLLTNEYKTLNKKSLINSNLLQDTYKNNFFVNNKNKINDQLQGLNHKKLEETKSLTGVLKEEQLSKYSNSSNDRYYGIDKWMEKHHELLRRSKIVKKFYNTNLSPKSMILTVLPVLPPDLRPIMKMADQIATSDLNRLYQRVLYRNERLKKIVMQLSDSNLIGISDSFFKTIISDSQIQQEFYSNNINNIPNISSEVQNIKQHGFNITNSLDTPLFGYEKHYAQRLLQEAVDNLIDNGRSGGNSEKDAKGRALKSLSEVLKGKQGRFRQYLLGKRVDYSGRSVIVVGPKLKIHQCGLPREMAIELYLPFIIQYLIQMKYTKTVVGAKSLIAQNKELIESILDNVVRGHPIILNRAPTLHRLGFQAFQPILVEGRAILLHPMACTAFNADFDGDQMAVHIPITIEARSEAWRLMLARNNLLSPATGEPIILPSQDMVLGCYYLTTTRKFKKEHYLFSNDYYSDLNMVLYHYYMGKLHIHSPVWLKMEKIVLTDSIKKPVEIRICNFGTIQEIYMSTEYHYTYDGELINQYIRTTPGRILFNLIIKNI